MAAPAQITSIPGATLRAAEEFEAHTEACYWCKFHPFAKCSTGAKLQRAIALEISAEPE